MKRYWLTCLGLVLLVGVVALIVISTGALPFTASSGHWPATAWFLEFAMERSVTTHSLGIQAPPLDNQALVRRGASHYEQGCAWCHGRPGQSPSRITMHMTPHAPDLTDEVEQWSAAQLFYIVGHGVKFTAMPAWPDARRRDEVWAVVAFLQHYPRLSPEDYQHLAGLDEKQRARSQIQSEPIPERVIAGCIQCHGIDGLGRQAAPKLAGQSALYLSDSIHAYQTAARTSGIMGPAVEALNPEEVQQAAQYFAGLPSPSDQPISSSSLFEEGRSVALHGLVKEKVGACMQCHSQTQDAPALAEYPHLAGQRADYLVQQLHLFRQQNRGGSERHKIMNEIAGMLSDQQIRAVAHYYAHLAQ